jgi:predicted AlkP superfamily phosphohydrolase/phosphomutase
VTTTGTTKRSIGLVALLALATAVTLLALTVGGCGGGRRDTKVVMLGIDGMDWSIADRLMEEGKLPNIASVIERGTRSDLRTIEPLIKSPMIWATIATGKGPRKHGITDFVDDAEGAPLYNSFGWRARPIWDILGENGRRVCVMNWMVTWPARETNGYWISDLIPFAPEDGFDRVENLTYPEELAERLDPYRKPFTETTDDEIAPFLNGDDWRTTTNHDIEAGVSSFRTIYANDQSVRDMALHLLETEDDLDFFAVYLNGLDLCCHRYWGQMDPTPLSGQLTEESIEVFKDVIPRYYEHIDRFVGEVLDRLDENTTLVICSDHGFRGPYFSDQGLRLGIWMHGPLGVLAAMGPGISVGGEVGEASVFDVTPTLLALYGLPVARDMDGFVLEGLLSEDVLDSSPVDYIDTYEVDSKFTGDLSESPGASPVDEEIKERLRSLGYIE